MFDEHIGKHWQGLSRLKGILAFMALPGMLRRESVFSASQFENAPFKLSHLLSAHRGCVNSLHFSQHGDMLVSGSDDTTVAVWDTRPGAPLKKLVQLHSGHMDNVFDVKFAPGMEKERMVSAARDGMICFYNGWAVDEDCALGIPFSDDTLKSIEFFDNSPHVFGVCCEDGRVYEYDFRVGHRNIVLDLSPQQVNLYSMSTCPSKPELLAVCGSDPFVRFYDRRKMSSQQNTAYCWTPLPTVHSSISFFTGVRFSRFSYDLAAYGVNRAPCLINPIFQCDEQMKFEAALVDDFEDSFLWSHEVDVYKCGWYHEALPLITHQISRHLRLRVHPLWKQIFHAELFNRALLLGLMNMPLSSMHADLEVIVRNDPQPSASVKYLLLMVVLMLGHFDEFELLCDSFSDLDSTEGGLDFKIFKDILAVCEIDPAQSNTLIPNSIQEVCKQLEMIDINNLPATKQLKSGELGDFEGFVGYFEKACSRRTFKGVGFAGDRDQYIAVGSDGGHAFLYQNPSHFGAEYKKRPVWAAIGDSQITNVVEGHPSRPIIVTSGIDNTIKVFEPSQYVAEDVEENDLQAFKTFTGAELQNIDANDRRSESWFDALYEGVRFIIST